MNTEFVKLTAAVFVTITATTIVKRKMMKKIGIG